MTTSDLVEGMNGLVEFFLKRKRLHQERIDEEGCGAVFAACRWRRTKKGRWRRARGFSLSFGISRAESHWWTNRADEMGAAPTLRIIRDPQKPDTARSGP